MRKLMISVQEFTCEICGTTTNHPVHWFVIQCGSSELTVIKWNSEAASATGARHYCGEGHAQVYISRWFESVCTPPKPDFMRSGIQASATIQTLAHIEFASAASSTGYRS